MLGGRVAFSAGFIRGFEATIGEFWCVERRNGRKSCLVKKAKVKNAGHEVSKLEESNQEAEP